MSKKHRRPDDDERMILTLCAWAPFFCPTPRGGWDPVIRDEILWHFTFGLNVVEVESEVLLRNSKGCREGREVHRCWTFSRGLRGGCDVSVSIPGDRDLCFHPIKFLLIGGNIRSLREAEGHIRREQLQEVDGSHRFWHMHPTKFQLLPDKFPEWQLIV